MSTEIPEAAVAAAAHVVAYWRHTGPPVDSDRQLAAEILEAAEPLLAAAWGVAERENKQRRVRRPPESAIAALRALAASPEGLPTPDVSAAAGKITSDGWGILRSQEVRGRVVRVSDTGKGPAAHVWQITEEGRRFLAATEAPDA
jgi:hypothetical protein